MIAQQRLCVANKETPPTILQIPEVCVLRVRAGPSPPGTSRSLRSPRRRGGQSRFNALYVPRKAARLALAALLESTA
ncbi:hypothetical protein NHX12_012569 [Muraenolepis orangiensis]|uniref:Uncharacterized protein n=1 Tax=Muraenolepis orangiensis TaxID=630683 RepID=A0A9Q0I614_9TELE|nr:hypothetical protein NHX12_012569 [Muraenolepis orangiensis]